MKQIAISTKFCHDVFVWYDHSNSYSLGTEIETGLKNDTQGLPSIAAKRLTLKGQAGI